MLFRSKAGASKAFLALHHGDACGLLLLEPEEEGRKRPHGVKPGQLSRHRLLRLLPEQVQSRRDRRQLGQPAPPAIFQLREGLLASGRIPVRIWRVACGHFGLRRVRFVQKNNLAIGYLETLPPEGPDWRFANCLAAAVKAASVARANEAPLSLIPVDVAGKVRAGGVQRQDLALIAQEVDGSAVELDPLHLAGLEVRCRPDRELALPSGPGRRAQVLPDAQDEAQAINEGHQEQNQVVKGAASHGFFDCRT